MVKTAMAIEREVDVHGASEMRVLVMREMRVNSLRLAQEKSRRLLLYEGFKERVVATKAKAMISHPKMGETSRLPASQGRGHLSCATS